VTEDLTGLLLIGVALVAVVALSAVSSPSKSPRIRLKGTPPLAITLPELCVVTGDPSTEHHVVRSYMGNPWTVGVQQIELPFSAEGWRRFRERHPLSLTVLKAVIHGLLHVPLIGAYCVIYLWLPLAVVPFGVWALIDLAMARRPLVKVHKIGYTLWKEELREVSLSVASSAFAEEFGRLNEAATVRQR